jgi:hypothetical protein
MTTNTDENLYIDNELLCIPPTLQDKNLVEIDGSILNLTKEGICASLYWYNCTSVNQH